MSIEPAPSHLDSFRQEQSMAGVESVVGRLDEVGDAPVLVLSQTRTDVERSIVARATGGRGDPEVTGIDDPDLGSRLDDDELVLVPVRVAWLPEERAGEQRVHWRDLLRLEDPRRPRRRTQERIVADAPDRYRLIVGAPASVGDLRRRWLRVADADAPSDFTDWVRRQAEVTLARAERSVIGQRYKVPRHAAEDIASSASFRAEVAALARRLGRPESEVTAEAREALDRVVAAQSRLAIDAFDAITGPLFRRAWDIDVDTSALDELRALNRRKGLVFLPAHRSYVDPLVLGQVLTDAGFPRNHLPGGQNLDFWPLGPIARRAGVIFIPRTLQDDPVTKLALREYLGFLASKRFNLEWYMEAGRSRTGKLRPPKFGLLQFVVDAMRNGRVDDMALVPVSITYDRLPEVGLMAAEEQGQPKRAEGIGWLADYARANANLLGTVHVRFGRPLSLRDSLGAAEDAESDRQLALQKVGFEVFNRINAVTPITPMSLTTLALLGVGGRALTVEEVRDAAAPFVAYLRARRLPVTDEDAVTRLAGVQWTLERLQSAGIVTRYAAGTEPVFVIESGQHHAAAFYRNGAIHWFVNRAISEVAVVLAIRSASDDLVGEAWRHCLALRDLLKFEFFFSDKRTFYQELLVERAVLGLEDDAALPTEPDDARAALAAAGFLAAPIVLRPFVDAYAVVADRLAARSPRRVIDRAQFVEECVDVGRQYLLQQRLRSPESVSPELFATALKLVANRDLLDPGRDEVARGRQALAEEVVAVRSALDVLEELAAASAHPSVADAGAGDPGGR